MQQLETDYSIGESERKVESIGESERKVEMTFGDFGAPVLVSAPPAGEVYIRIAGRRNRGVRPQAGAEPELGGPS